MRKENLTTSNALLVRHFFTQAIRYFSFPIYPTIANASPKALTITPISPMPSGFRPTVRKQRTFGETSTAINGTVPAVNWYRSDGSLVLKIE